MAEKVNVQFGGTKPTTYGNVEAIQAAFETFAQNNGLVKKFFRVVPREDNNCEVEFMYRKVGLAEGNLNAFFTTWKNIVNSQSVTRSPIRIIFYEE